MKKKNTFSLNNKGLDDNSHEMGDRIPSQTLDPEERIIKKQKILEGSAAIFDDISIIGLEFYN